MTALSELFGEDHRCQQCGLSYRDIAVPAALQVISSIPDEAREVVVALDLPSRRARPGDGGWSVTEYLCHLRDVYVTYTIRLHRAGTESEPQLEPMFNDLRAVVFDYNGADAECLLAELQRSVSGFLAVAEVFDADAWDRVVRRRPGEDRSARWLVRQAMHEGVHHLGDIRRVARAVQAPNA